jgi:two-component system, NarL family, response regulator LiaR
MIEENSSSGGEHTPAEAGGVRLRAIVVDDDPMARRLVRDALELADIVVIAEAGSGREAVELVQFYKPDIVLMDVVMPGMDGIEATRRIIRALPDARVVMLTRSDDDELGLLGLRAGAVGFLTKDVDISAIPRAVRGAHAGEAAISRHLSMKLVERMRSLPEGGVGTRPVRSTLTPREWEVLDLLCEGQSTAAIADSLVLSLETVRSHIKNLMRKLGVRTREEAVDQAAALRAPSPAEQPGDH